MLVPLRVIFPLLALLGACHAGRSTRAIVYRALNASSDTPQSIGTVTFTEIAGNQIKVEGELRGVPAGVHGFHVHEKGELGVQCLGTGAHFNPDNVTHGGPQDAIRHTGDLGNVQAGSDGVVRISIVDSKIAFSGRNSILGRGIVLHQKVDDLGRGGTNVSLATGDAGARIACGKIGAASFARAG